MNRFRFTVDGPLLGYRKSTIPVRTRKVVMRLGVPQAQVLRVNDRRYTAFLNKVLVLAMEQGYRKRATSKDRPATLSVLLMWGRDPRLDWKNAVGAIEDALFDEDRYVFPGRIEVFTQYGCERAEVTIEEG